MVVSRYVSRIPLEGGGGGPGKTSSLLKEILYRLAGYYSSTEPSGVETGSPVVFELVRRRALSSIFIFSKWSLETAIKSVLARVRDVSRYELPPVFKLIEL